MFGVPTELARRLLAGEVDVAPIPSIEWARNADKLRLLPRLCVSSEGAVDSIQLVSPKPIEDIRSDRGHAGERNLGRARTHPLPERDPRPTRAAGGREALDWRRGPAERVRRSHAAPRPGSASGPSAPACRWCSRSGPAGSPARRGRGAGRRSRRVRSAGALRAGSARTRGDGPLRLSGRFFLARYFEKLRYRFGPRERAALFTFLELARDAGEPDRVPNSGRLRRSGAAC